MDIYKISIYKLYCIPQCFTLALCVCRLMDLEGVNANEATPNIARRVHRDSFFQYEIEFPSVEHCKTPTGANIEIGVIKGNLRALPVKVQNFIVHNVSYHGHPGSSRATRESSRATLGSSRATLGSSRAT